MKGRISALLAVLLVVAALLPGCQPAPAPATAVPPTAEPVKPTATPVPAEPTKPAKTTLVIGQYGDPPLLDPHKALNDNAMRVEVQIYDPLVRMDKDFKPVPCVAESWVVSPDGREYTFKIRKGIKFHNGDELKASDVAFSINRGVANPQAAPSYAGTTGAVLVDEDHVKVTLVGPNPQILAAFSLPLAGILSEKVVTGAEAAGGTYGREPIGSGPFKFAGWVTGEKIDLVAFEDYHLGPPKLKHVTFRAIADHSAAVIALEKGELDAYVDLSQPNFAQVRANKSLELHMGKSFGYYFVSFNNAKPPFDNLLVRQAIAHAIDKDALVNGVSNGVGEIVDTIAAPYMLGYTTDIVRYDYDLDKAKALLKEAGYPNGFKCEISVYLDLHSKYAQVIQNSLDQIGIKAEVKLYERSAFEDLTFGPNKEMFVYGYTYSGPDLSDVANYNLFHSKNIALGRSRLSYSNPKADALLDEGRTTLDDARRAQIYKEFLILISEDVPLIPFIWNYKNIVTNARLMNVNVQPQSLPYFYGWEWAQ